MTMTSTRSAASAESARTVSRPAIPPPAIATRSRPLPTPLLLSGSMSLDVEQRTQSPHQRSAQCKSSDAKRAPLSSQGLRAKFDSHQGQHRTSREGERDRQEARHLLDGDKSDRSADRLRRAGGHRSPELLDSAEA